MTTHYRDRVELVTVILQVCRTPSIKSKITRDANISYNALQPFLEKLENLGFLRLEPSESQSDGKPTRWSFITTQAGLEWTYLTEPWCKIMSKIWFHRAANHTEQSIVFSVEQNVESLLAIQSSQSQWRSIISVGTVQSRLDKTLRLYRVPQRLQTPVNGVALCLNVSVTHYTQPVLLHVVLRSTTRWELWRPCLNKK